MSDFLVVRNIKSPLGDVHISGDEPKENVDYNLMVDVSLYEVREKKGTGDEDGGTKTYIFVPTGPIRLINVGQYDKQLESGPIDIGGVSVGTLAEREATGISD